MGDAVYKSPDGGQSWTPHNAGLKEHVSVVNQFVFHPTDADLIYVATTVGVFRSKDGGRLWEERMYGMKEVHYVVTLAIFFFSSRRRHTRCSRDWSSDVCSSDLWRNLTPMPAQMIDGRAIAAKVREEVAADVQELGDVGLSTVLVGDDPASDVYIRGKQKAALSVGIRANDIRLPAETTEEELLALLAELN